MEIRHIAVSESTPLFAVGSFKHDVEVWDFSERRKVADLKTILDFGGQRLAIYNKEVKLLIAGVYRRNGICAYDLAQPGATPWWRRDLKNPQVITVSERLGLMASSFGYRALKLLNVVTGETIRTIHKAFDCYFGPRDDEILLAESFGTVWSASVETGKTISRFAVPHGALDIAQSEDSILISCHSTSGAPSDVGNMVRAAGSLLCFSRDACLLAH